MADGGAAKVIPNYDSIDVYIDDHKVEKGCEFTHTSLSNPPCSFYVPVDELDMFYDLYSRALEGNADLHITEKNRHIGPIVVDMDFRFKDISNKRRRHNADHIDSIVRMYVDTIKAYLDVGTGFHIYVLEKDQPYVSNGMLKDGVHLVIPDVVTRASIKFMIRQDMLPKLKDIVQEIGSENKVEDIVDEAVISKNNWFMHGSKKPGGSPYKVTHAYKYDAVELKLQDEGNKLDDSELVRLLSIRNKYNETPPLASKKTAIADYERAMDKKRRSTDVARAVLQTEQNHRVNQSEDMELVGKLVDILDANRADNYNDWIRLGWCLRNIDNRLLSKWVEFSKKSRKFVAGECERLWDRMKDGGLGTGTLHMWAKKDNPTEYKRIMRNDLRNLMYMSTSMTHYDIACVIHHIYKHDYVCSSIKNRCWYEFRNHRWHASDSGLGLRSKISDEVWKEYNQAAIEYNQIAIGNPNPAEQTRYTELAKKMNEIALKLKTTNFKENIMKECTELFYVEKFEERLDSDPNFIGFENGVYDLTTMEFREGRPEDYISFSTRNDYIEHDPDHPVVAEINKYMSQVLTKASVREYVLKLFASFLSGHIKEQKFNIWTGSGSNSKSLCIELFEKSFGDYCCKFPITLLTQKRAASNAATSELARAKGKRFATLQEPSEDEKLNIGLMKELSGGDVILARAIYKEPIEFKPMFKMVLLCNQLPHVPSDDGGTWRRIRVVEFTSKFCENPNPNNPNEFPIDYTLSERHAVWKQHFIPLLLEYYKHYIAEGIAEPPEVVKCTQEYKQQQDHMANFLATRVEKKESAFLSLDDLFVELRNWIRDDAVAMKLPSKPEVEKYMVKNVTKCVVLNHMKGFKGYRIITNYQGSPEDDEDNID